MRGHFGVYFFVHVGTFVFLTETLKKAPEFNVDLWPQFSLYNLLVSNFWPLYWVGYFVDRTKLDGMYWHVYEVAQARAVDVFQLIDLLIG